MRREKDGGTKTLIFLGDFGDLGGKTDEDAAVSSQP
jgi:hypothetical protein